MKTFFLTAILGVTASNQMEEIENIRRLMAMDMETIIQYQDPAGDLVFLPARQNYFLAVRRPLLPGDICKGYIEEAPFAMGDKEYGAFWSVVRLIQEDEHTRRVDFYSKELEYNNDSAADSLMLDSMKSDISQIMLDNGWLAQLTESHSNLVFRYQELEMTIMFELLAYRQCSPFWYELNAYPNIIWPPGYERSFHRYIHFVIRERKSG